MFCHYNLSRFYRPKCSRCADYLHTFPNDSPFFGRAIPEKNNLANIGSSIWRRFFQRITSALEVYYSIHRSLLLKWIISNWFLARPKVWRHPRNWNVHICWSFSKNLTPRNHNQATWGGWWCSTTLKVTESWRFIENLLGVQPLCGCSYLVRKMVI